jgi:hypothetical protein
MISSSAIRASIEGFFLGRVIVTGKHVLVGLHPFIHSHGAVASVDGLGNKAKPGQLVLTPLLVARGRRRPVIVGVVVEVAEGGEKGVLLSLGLLEVLLLQHLLVESSLRLVLGGVLALVLALARVVLVEGVLVLLGAVGDEVVRISTAVASFLRTTTTSAIQAVVVKPREPANDQRQLVVPKTLHLLLCDRHQRRQGKRHL